jgi:signal transduction histidine kinase
MSALGRIRERIGGLFMSGKMRRAVPECFVAAMVFMLVVLAYRPYLGHVERQNGIFVALLTGLSLYALRLRPGGGRWWRYLAYEGLSFLAALILGVVLYVIGMLMLPRAVTTPDQAGLTAIVSAVLGLDTMFGAIHDPTTLAVALMALMLFCGAIAYGSLRFGAHIWRFWSRLRRQRLLWALTHSHMMLVVLMVLIFGMITTLNVISYFVPVYVDVATPINILLTLVPVGVAFGVLTLISLLSVLPPSILLAYFAARRTTRRLERLANAAEALRESDYEARVIVEGEDEIAQLQTAFNAMAERLEDAIAEAESERDAVSRLLDSRRELVANVSHELRTPVAILRSHIESMMAQRDGTFSAEVLRDFDVIACEMARLQRLIDDLFALSRAEVGELELRIEAVDAAERARAVIEAVAPMAWRAGRVEVIADLPDSLSPVWADAARLEQILHNLIRNAVRHTPPGGIVAVGAKNLGDAVILEVRDTGEGIAPEDMPHIWERFYRSEGARSRDPDGAGLGLALVKELTESMGGEVGAESEPKQGSRFFIRLLHAATLPPSP